MLFFFYILLKVHPVILLGVNTVAIDGELSNVHYVVVFQSRFPFKNKHFTVVGYIQ